MEARELVFDPPAPDETLFKATRGGLPEIIAINRALLGFAHIEAFRWHLLVTIHAGELIDNGMPSPDDSALLFALGDEIEEALLAARTSLDAPNLLFLARSTWNGAREYAYYVHDPEIANAALQALLARRTWEREWDYRMKEDPAWEEAGHVFKLFPDTSGLHS